MLISEAELLRRRMVADLCVVVGNKESPFPVDGEPKRKLAGIVLESTTSAVAS